jgi:hypothetical protein
MPADTMYRTKVTPTSALAACISYASIRYWYVEMKIANIAKPDGMHERIGDQTLIDG